VTHGWAENRRGGCGGGCGGGGSPGTQLLLMGWSRHLWPVVSTPATASHFNFI